MDLIQLTERIYCLPYQTETDQPNLFYIRGDACAAAIDAGQSKRHVTAFYQAIRDRGMPLPRYTLITHWHWDHTFGLPYVQGETVANVLTQEKLREVSRWEWTDAAMRAREAAGIDIPFCCECIRKEYPRLDEIRVITVETGISAPREIDLGGARLRLIPMDSPHTRDAMMIYMPEEKALFAGDADCEDHYDNHGRYDPEKLRAYLGFLRSLDFEGYYIGHDQAETKAKTLAYLSTQLP